MRRHRGSCPTPIPLRGAEPRRCASRIGGMGLLLWSEVSRERQRFSLVAKFAVAGGMCANHAAGQSGDGVANLNCCSILSVPRASGSML